MTVLARTKLVIAAGGFAPPPGSAYEDWGCWLNMLDLGTRFVYLPERRWIWHWHEAQTQGLGDR